MFVIYRDRYLPSGGRDQAFQSSLVYYRDNCWNPSTDAKIACGEPEAGRLCQQDSFLQFPSSWGSAPSERGEVFQLFQQRTSVFLMAGDKHDLCVHLALITAFVPTLFSGLGVPLPGEVSASWSSSWKLSDTLRISLILG